MFKNLIQWSHREYFHLPWRQRRSLYGTLVSEFMLQQTTVPTVIRYFDPFLQRFPDLVSLSQATEEEVCIQWKGLGYYRRARALREASLQIVRDFGGKIPERFEDLLKIKGIGPYTANALCSIGADRKALPLDANLERVLSRLYSVEGPQGPVLQKKIYRLFEEGKILADMQKWGPRNLGEAFMDLGRTFCRVQNPQCSECPMSSHCQSYREGRAAEFPQVNEKLVREKKNLHSLSLLRIVSRKKNQIMVYKKKEGEWLSGQWELPTFVLESTDSSLIQYPSLNKKEVKAVKDGKGLQTFKTTITKYKIQNFIWEISEKEFKERFPDFPGEIQFRPWGDEKENFAVVLMKTLKALEKEKEKEK